MTSVDKQINRGMNEHFKSDCKEVGWEKTVNVLELRPAWCLTNQAT